MNDLERLLSPLLDFEGEVATANSNSWRRFVLTGKGPDRPFIEPTVHPIDGHPDLSGARYHESVAALINAYRDGRLVVVDAST